MRIAICDDDIACREQVAAVVEDYKKQKCPELEISVYDTASALMGDVLRYGCSNIYILDVIMPGTNGIQLGKQLRQEDAEGKIIYLTSSRDYAVDSYRVKAQDYLIKPVDAQQLFDALDEAMLNIAVRREKSIIVRNRESSVKIVLDSILYVKLEGKSIVWHLTNNSLVEGMTIRSSFAEAIQELLQDGRFSLCGSGMAVNLYYIDTIRTDSVILRNGRELHIGRRAARDLRSAWMDFWMNREGSK